MFDDLFLEFGDLVIAEMQGKKPPKPRRPRSKGSETAESLRLDEQNRKLKLLKKHMREMWVAETVNGLKVVDRTLGFGQLPDIKLLLEDGHWVSAKKMFNV